MTTVIIVEVDICSTDKVGVRKLIISEEHTSSEEAAQ